MFQLLALLVVFNLLFAMPLHGAMGFILLPCCILFRIVLFLSQLILEFAHFLSIDEILESAIGDIFDSSHHLFRDFVDY